MNGFRVYTQPAATLMPGQRLPYFGWFRSVASVERASDGTGHLVVHFTNDAPCARYLYDADVRVLVIENLPESATPDQDADPSRDQAVTSGVVPAVRTRDELSEIEARSPSSLVEPATDAVAVSPAWPVAGSAPLPEPALV